MSVPAKPGSEPNRERRRFELAQFGSGVAVLVSFLALGLGVYQTRIMQQQARASVWPYVTIGSSYYDAGPEAGFTWQVYNNGVGLARIESVVARVDGKSVKSWDALLQGVLGRPRAEVSKVTFSTIHRGVLPPDINRETAINAVHLEDPADAARFEEAIEAKRLELEICYCSVYDDCWVAKSFQQQSPEVARCDVDPSQEFAG